MPRFPEPIGITRTIDHGNGRVVTVRGGVVFRVAVRRDDGRVIRFFEAERNGMVIACETRADAFETLRNI